MEIEMFQPKLIAGAAALCLSLGACQTTGTGGTSARDLLDIVTAVQSGATTVCGFVPTAQAIANIVAAGDPTVQTASAIVTAICGAIAPQPKASRLRAARRATAPVIVVNGRAIPVAGEFVR